MKTVWEAMNDVTRRKILTLLKKGDMTASEIYANFESRPATISHHLGILREANLVTFEKSGQVITYSLNIAVFQSMVQKLISFLER